MELGDRAPVTAAVIGVVHDDWPGAEPQAYVLYEQLHRWIGADGSGAQSGGSGPGAAGPMQAQMPAILLWVPADQADAIGETIARDLQASAPGWQVDTFDNRYNSGGLDRATKWVGIGIGGFALLLGGLGLVNIALVTVRYRIREIGIRRSFGATSGRVFFGVLLESVVATVVAGLVGVVLAVAIIKNIPVERVFGGGIQDMPPFPFSAALVGMAAAVAVGRPGGADPRHVRRPCQGHRRHPVLTYDAPKRLCTLRWMFAGSRLPSLGTCDHVGRPRRAGARRQPRRVRDHPEG